MLVLCSELFINAWTWITLKFFLHFHFIMFVELILFHVPILEREFVLEKNDKFVWVWSNKLGRLYWTNRSPNWIIPVTSMYCASTKLHWIQWSCYCDEHGVVLDSDGASVNVADSRKGVGSVLVDYFVELTDVGRRVDTQEMKKLFHNSLSADPDAVSSRLQLGSFIVDPKSTDFIGKLRDSVETDARAFCWR